MYSIHKKNLTQEQIELVEQVEYNLPAGVGLTPDEIESLQEISKEKLILSFIVSYKLGFLHATHCCSLGGSHVQIERQ